MFYNTKKKNTLDDHLLIEKKQILSMLFLILNILFIKFERFQAIEGYPQISEKAVQQHYLLKNFHQNLTH